MSDILERAEALCGDTYRYEETTEDTDGTLRNLVDRANILPEMVAECKRQQAEAARWQAVAVEEWIKNDMGKRGPDLECRFAAEHAQAGHPRCVYCEETDDYRDCPMLELFTKRAAAALGSKPRAWLMTGGRIKAMYSVLRFGTQMLPCEEDEYNVLLTMLEEAKQ